VALCDLSPAIRIRRGDPASFRAFLFFIGHRGLAGRFYRSMFFAARFTTDWPYRRLAEKSVLSACGLSDRVQTASAIKAIAVTTIFFTVLSFTACTSVFCSLQTM